MTAGKLSILEQGIGAGKAQGACAPDFVPRCIEKRDSESEYGWVGCRQFLCYHRQS